MAVLSSTHRQQISDSWSPLVAIQTGGTKQPFFCVHGLGGHILLFEKLVQYLDSDQPFFAFQARGIENGQEPIKRIEDIAGYYIDAMRKVQSNGPYLLGGYSMGGTIAFEMAQQLMSQGQEVALLAIIDMPAQNPGLIHLWRFASRMGSLFGMDSEEQLRFFFRLRDYGFRLRAFGRLHPAGKIAHWRGKLNGRGMRMVASNSTPTAPRSLYVPEVYDEVDSDEHLDRRIQNICNINRRAYQAYIPRAYQGNIALIRSAGAHVGAPDKNRLLDPYLGWKRVISGVIDMYIVNGDHGEIIREPRVRILAQHLRTCLEKAQYQFDRSTAN